MNIDLWAGLDFDVVDPDEVGLALAGVNIVLVCQSYPTSIKIKMFLPP